MQDAGKAKDSANKRTLQKLEYVTEDLEKTQQELKQLKEKQHDKNKTINKETN